ncbi:MAG: tRNA (guanosine(46)-N7)-methyltransferase TrmB [Bacteroidia bacterium]|nr:tRNA (guanosine(46)-N7)-methyltransferase TrmB [Bacteroidia bacterium]
MPNKLEKFAEVESFPNCFFLAFGERENGLLHKGKWKTDFFKNENPILLELGCGKGEYSVGLAEKNPHKNFIGVDVKGNRIWTGAKSSIEKNLSNVAFVRTRIEFIEGCFAENEIDEIWLTFPDPQPQKTRVRKRLTHNLFLNRYNKFLKPGGLLHLKTDSTSLFEYSLENIAAFGWEKLESTNDLYNNVPAGRDELVQITTHYEKLFTDKGEKIKYCLFKKPA